MPPKQPPTPGAALDAVLAPFLQDDADLEQRLEDTQRQIDQLRSEADQIVQDRDVIRIAKIEALRHAAADDALLREAFINPIGHAGESESDRHRLLSPAG